VTLNVFIGGNPLKNIYLISFKTFLPKFMAFGCELFSVYPLDIIRKR